MRRERISGQNPEEHQQVRQGQKGGACKGERNQEEGGGSEDLCVTDAKEGKKWEDVSNAEEKSAIENAENSLLNLVTRKLMVTLGFQWKPRFREVDE